MVAVGVDAAGGPLGAAAPKLPMESADGDDAESVRARLRERVSSPCEDDVGGETAGRRPPARWAGLAAARSFRLDNVCTQTAGK